MEPLVLPAEGAASTRPVWRPRWYLWVLLWVAAVGALHHLQPYRFEGHKLVLMPLAIAVAVLVLKALWERPPVITMCAAIALTVFSGGWGQMGLGGLPLNRLLVLLALLQVLFCAPGAAHLPPLRFRNVHLVMFAAILYAVGSAAAAGTLGNSESLLLITDVFGIAPFLLFLVAPAVFSTPQERNLLLATLVGLGAYLSLTTILEALGPHALVWPHYIVLSDAARPGVLKPGGPFQAPVENGFANFACAVAAAMAYVRWRGRRSGRLALLVSATCLFGCFLTLERGVWVGALTAIVVVALCTRSGRRWLVPGAVIGVLALGAVLTVSPVLSQRTSERANTQQSVWDRKNMTAAGLRMVAAKPLFGFGWDRYEEESLEYFRQSRDYPMTGYTPVQTIGLPEVLQPLHNTYLAYAVEIGLIGMLLWLVSIGWAVGGAVFSRGSPDLRAWKLGLLAIFVFYAVVSFVDPHQLPFPVVLLMLWAGVAWGNEPARELTLEPERQTTLATRPAIPVAG
jgi:putative inorganic carbon (hco3(-)) transporter